MGTELKKPIPGEFYRHFKGNLYQVKMMAKDTEDGKDMVVYQGMYPPFACFVRNLVDFMGQVDEKKYPELAGRQRFVKIPEEQLAQMPHEPAGKEEISGEAPFRQDTLADEVLEKELCFGDISKYTGTQITEEDVAKRGFMLFLDADSFRKKRRIFIGLEPYLNEVLINNIAVTLDLVLEEEGKEARCDAILKCLDALEHYEGGRLR